MTTTTKTQTIIVRFANSGISDIRLLVTSVPASSDTRTSNTETQLLTFDHTLLALKHVIRTHLSSQYANKGLRLIQAGRVLMDGDTIALGLRLKQGQREDTVEDGEGRGNGEKDDKGKKRAVQPPPTYIHCVVSSEDVASSILEAEKNAAAIRHVQPTPSQRPRSSISPTSATTSPHQQQPSPPSQVPQPHQPQQLQAQQQPRGFNRLLTTGFTSQDVATLRAQFRAMTAARHTPDTMPDADALLRLEERWLDSEASNNNPATSSSANPTTTIGAAAGVADEEDSPSAALNDMILGIISGFFWPIGAVVWGLREEGVWSRRRGWAVLGGVAVNLAFGVVRGMG